MPHDTAPARPVLPANPPVPTAVIACAVLDQEVTELARGLANVVHVELLEQGLHDDPPLLRHRLQEAVDRVEAIVPAAEAVALAYGLCSRGTEGVRGRRCRLVIARAHDCITLLLGSKERYASYVGEHPGTYWYSPGWNRHHTPPGPERHRKLLELYSRQYGAENAEFLMESEQRWFSTYNRATYVDLTIGATEADVQYSRDCARWLEWDFDRQRGDPTLLRDLMAGGWDDQRFLVLAPGQSLRMTADASVIEVAPPCGAPPDLSPEAPARGCIAKQGT